MYSSCGHDKFYVGNACLLELDTTVGQVLVLCVSVTLSYPLKMVTVQSRLQEAIHFQADCFIFKRTNVGFQSLLLPF